jgi:hypothetical protein
MNEELEQCACEITRYLDCDDCREKDKECIYICVECGEEVGNTK